MNATIKHTASGFEVLKGSQDQRVGFQIAREASALILKAPEGMSPENLERLKNSITDQLKGNRPLHIEGVDGPVKFLEVTQEPPADAVFEMLYQDDTPDSETIKKAREGMDPQTFEKLYLGTWIEEANEIKPETLEAFSERLRARHEEERSEGLRKALRTNPLLTRIETDEISGRPFPVFESNEEAVQNFQGSPRKAEKLFRDKEVDGLLQSRKNAAETAKKFQFLGKSFLSLFTDQLIQAKEDLILDVLRQLLQRDPGAEDLKLVDLYERPGRPDLCLLAYQGKVLGGIKGNLLSDAPGWTFDPGIIDFK